MKRVFNELNKTLVSIVGVIHMLKFCMGMNNIYINLFYGFIAVVLFAGSFWVKPKTIGWMFYIMVIVGFSICGFIIDSYILSFSALLAGMVSIYRIYSNAGKTKSLEVIFIHDHDDNYLQHFLEYYRTDITNYFPAFDFKIEEEFLVALILSDMETVGLIVAEIKNADTLRICVDYMIPKYYRSELAKTFYNCELQCIDFLGYQNIYIAPQSKAHNQYLERIGFRLIDGKYINQYLGKCVSDNLIKNPN